MAESMDVDMGGVAPAAQPEPIKQEGGNTFIDALAAPTPPASHRDNSFREVMVKVHIRRPEKDSWMYLGRGIATQEVNGHSSRVVVRAQSSGKIITQFDETSDLQAEKRGNFVVIGLVDGSRVVSWSLNAPNNSETLRLLASIELACYRCKQALVDPRLHVKARRRIERIIKDDRRRRHRRRKDQDALIDAFARQTLSADNVPDPAPPNEAGMPPS
ncbi:hypothetical protein CC1G_10529 [Coprinopsis cinerea okayama7|uniref:Uncharacterized protein n=1 Tax=Coprinopsis cinerea (strain Okayama-7 / 130 / ATCC MYA-4618 / FGSC 9003) TaxID=240176 RepID=A8N1A8_COPC7|nr:hypothetical protein CC1G_10529 [Coprinopsis cinerea okayama7\|eukprot:XP_001828657.2 hypothetical protein CC1G_10529 [Coprinopsis cinerea okayama7\